MNTTDNNRTDKDMSNIYPTWNEMTTEEREAAIKKSEFCRKLNEENARLFAELKKNRFYKKSELKVGMNVVVVKNGDDIDSGVICEINKDEVIMMDGEEGFSYNMKDVRFKMIG